jgi:hypothetical protein
MSCRGLVSIADIGLCAWLLTSQVVIIPTRGYRVDESETGLYTKLLCLWLHILASRTRRATGSILGCHEEAAELGQRFFVESQCAMYIAVKSEYDYWCMRATV